MASRIIVVNNQLEDLEPIIGWLRDSAHEVTLINRGDQAIQMAAQQQTDLILLDSMGTDSIDLCRQLRRNASTAQIPVVLILPGGDNDLRSAGILAGANDFITRPIQNREAQRRLAAILNAGDMARVNNRRLLEETCQAATVILPCELAWIMVAEGMVLHSKVIGSSKGENAAEVFLRLAAGGSSQHPSFPLLPDNNPISEAALVLNPSINVMAQQIRTVIGGESLYRALAQLRLSYAHFLPLVTNGQVIGMFVLASAAPFEVGSPRSVQVLQTLQNQAVTVVENTRLLSQLIARDEQMKIEQTFRKMVLDTMGDGLLVIDDQAVIRYSNNRVLRMTGYTRQELYGSRVDMIFHPSGRQAVLDSVRGMHQTTRSFAYELVTRTGHIVPVLMTRAVAHDVPAQPLTTVLVLSDLTDLKKREDALEAAYNDLRASDKLKDDLLQNISHELKTPLQQIIFELTLLSEGDFGRLNEEQQATVQTVMKRIGQLGSRVNDMLSLHEVETNQIALVPLQVVEVVALAVNKVQARARQAGKKIAVSVPPDLPIVMGDSKRLIEALEHLLDNAIKFAPEANRIELSLCRVESVIRITVRDFGIGIPKAELPKIFQRGYQVDSGMARRFAGTGLGLAVVKQIMEAHGGSVSVESLVGKGSQFNLNLPVLNP